MAYAKEIKSVSTPCNKNSSLKVFLHPDDVIEVLIGVIGLVEAFDVNYEDESVDGDANLSVAHYWLSTDYINVDFDNKNDGDSFLIDVLRMTRKKRKFRTHLHAIALVSF